MIIVSLALDCAHAHTSFRLNVIIIVLHKPIGNHRNLMNVVEDYSPICVLAGM